jgi:RimJ/RimL family protein N-acetyltransferase
METAMPPDTADEPIRTTHLELVTLTTRFVQAVVEADMVKAGAEIGASVARWLVADPSHVVQLHLAGQAAEAMGYPGLGRAVVLDRSDVGRRVIGSVGFLGPPDDRGRLEASCRIHPAHRSEGYAAEALAAVLDWSTERYGVTRFLVAMPARGRDPDVGLLASDERR